MKSIAVLIPVFNDFDGLIKALDSVVPPEDCYLMAVIVDDGSLPKIELNNSKYSFDINVLRNIKNQGIIKSLNKGLEYICQRNIQYVARLDAGDTMTSHRLNLQLAAFEEDEALSLIGGFVDFQYEGKFEFRVIKPVDQKTILNKMHLNSQFCHTAVMFKTEVYRRIGGYRDKYEAAEDYDLFWRISKNGNVRNIPVVIGSVDNNPLGVSIARRGKQLKTRLSIQLENFGFFNLYSWMGIVQTVVMILTPQQLIYVIKKLRGVA